MPTPEQAAALRQALTAAGFTDSALIAKLGDVTLPTSRTRTLPRLLYQTAGGSHQETLARLFLFGVPVPVEAVRAALAPVPPETLCDLGLVRSLGGQMVSNVVLYPYGKLLIVFDRPEKVVSGAPRDLVMGISTSTIDLSNFTVRTPSRNTLDLGSGCGFQSFLAAAHSERVTAVDISARSVAVTRFNAALSGVGNVECLQGDRFEPVRGRRFDLIVGNLPFIISPADSYLFRDSGMALDRFAEEVLRAAPGYLEEGGWCQVICEWAHVAGEDWHTRIGRWIEGSGCDAWVLKLSTAKPELYAEMWIRDTEKEDAQFFDATFNEWIAWYEHQRIEAISTGLIAMRRTSRRRTWVQFDEWPDHLPEGFGAQVQRRFARYDFLERMETDAGLLEEVLAVSPEARLLTSNEWAPEGWHVREARLALEGLPAFAGNINNHLGNLLSLCDGQRTLGECVRRMAELMKVEPARVSGPCIPLVRQLIEKGFLLPREAQGSAGQ